MNVGACVRFKAHGETGLVCTVITRDGDDVTLQDPRGRLLHRTPIELLELSDATITVDGVPLEHATLDPDATLRINKTATPAKAWREVDELNADIEAGLITPEEAIRGFL